MRDPRWSLVALQSALTSASLGLTGEVTRVALLMPLLCLAAARLQRRRWEPGRGFHVASQLVAFLMLLYFVASLRHSMLAGAVALTLPVQAHYLLLPADRRTLGRLQVLSFFQLVALAAATTGLYFVVPLLGYLATSPAVLTLTFLEDAVPGERRPVPLPRGAWRACALATLPALAVGAAGFLVMPRYEAGLLRDIGGDRPSLSGFSDRVNLGEINRIKQNEALVMRVRVEGEPPPVLRWRGMALDHFSGYSWTATRTVESELVGRRQIELAPVVAGVATFTQEYSLEPIRSRVVFHAANPRTVRSRDFGALQRDAWGNVLRWIGSRGRVRYEVVSQPSLPRGLELSEELRRRCLQLPDIDPRVEGLAREVTAGAESPAAMASRIESHLATSHPYTLDVNDAGIEDPVSTFLLERRGGHCEYFASGMAIMLRTLGVPARVVNGFQSGRYSRWSRSWIVRQRDAHSWVEAWIEGRGWIAYDPTPPAPTEQTSTWGNVQELWSLAQELWDDHVIGFNYSHQLSALVTLREWWDAALVRLRSLQAGAVAGVAAAAGAIALLVVVLRVRRHRRARTPVAFYGRVLRLLEKHGHARRDGQTAGELAAEVAVERPTAAGALDELTRLYHEARFAGRPPSGPRVEALLRELAEELDRPSSAAA